MVAAGVFAAAHILAGSIAGQLADRCDKAALTRMLSGANIAVMAAAGAALLLDSVLLLMAMLFVSGVRGTLFGPIKYAILPDHLDRRELLLGTGLIQGGGTVLALCGSVLGALLPAPVTAGLMVALAASAFLASLFVPPAPAPRPDLRIDWNIAAGLAGVVGSAMARPAIRGAILGITWFFVLGAVFTSQTAPLVRNAIGGSEQVGALFLAVFSVGIAAGSVIVHRLLAGEISARLVPAAALAVALGSADLWLASHGVVRSGEELIGPSALLAQVGGWRLLLDLLVISAGTALFVVPLYAILQTAGDPAERARDVAANNVVNAAAVIASAGIVALLIEFGVTSAGIFLLFGLLTFAIGASVWRRRLAPAA